MVRFRSPTRLVGRVLVFLGGGVLLLTIAFYLSENRSPAYRILDPTETTRLTAALHTHGEPPANYVLHKFADHSVIILGEPHWVREHYEFLTQLLPLLPIAGVNQVAIELFARSSQPQIDQLLTGVTFDESLARRVVLSATRYFYFEELYAVLQKAWEVNRSGRRLRILGLYSLPGDREVRQHSGDRDLWQAETVSQAVDEGGKTLVYIGVNHAFTSYSQPGLPGLRSPVRMGNYLKGRFGKAPFFINLHYPVYKKYWPVSAQLAPSVALYRKGWVLPFGGVLDQVFQAYSSPVGFDTAAQEFDHITDTFSYYAQGPALHLSDFCDGYIYLNPIDQYHFVRPLHGLAASEEDRVTLRAILGKQTQRQYFGSQAAAEEFVQRDGFSPQRVLADLDMRGLKDVMPPSRTWPNPER